MQYLDSHMAYVEHSRENPTTNLHWTSDILAAWRIEGLGRRRVPRPHYLGRIAEIIAGCGTLFEHSGKYSHTLACIFGRSSNTRPASTINPILET